MIIQELGKFIVIDEIRHDATASELYFLSCLLGNEMLSLSEDWPGRIYTSQFIYDILLKKKPRVHPKCFRVLKPNVPTKFKSKNKTVWVTMFEPEEIKNSVMFHFDDSINKYLYTGVFNEVNRCYRNENFMLYAQKGIDYVYINTVLCNSDPYICTGDVIDEIQKIALKHPDYKLALIVPNFGYEKLLIHLVRAFPQNVCLTKTQSFILSKLGYNEFIGTNGLSCRIIMFLPGISTEFLETNFIAIYITAGNAFTLNNEYGVYMRQWYPVPSLMDQQILMELIRPNYIVPIEENCFLERFELPFSIRALAKRAPSENHKSNRDTIDTENWSEHNSIVSIEESNSSQTKSENNPTTISMPCTKAISPQAKSTKTPNIEKPKELKKENQAPMNHKVNTKLPVSIQFVDLTKKRTRVIRQRKNVVFSDSDDDFVITK